MKILLCDFLYPGLVKEYYTNISNKEKTYKELKNGITSFSYQWLPYFYLEGQKNKLNIDIVFPEDQILQKKWASEKNIIFKSNWKENILLDQVINYKPDIFYFAGNFNYYDNFFKKIKPYVGKIFCWISAEIPKKLNLQDVDLMISDNKKILDYSISKGTKAFKMLSSVPQFNGRFKKYKDREIGMIFTGSLGRQFKERNNILKFLKNNKIALEIYGKGLAEDSFLTMPIEVFIRKLFPNIYDKLYIKKYIPIINPLKNNVKNPIFGENMISTLNNSKMVLNVHSDFDIDFAINMRVFEALSMGCLLFTEKNTEVEKHFQHNKHLVIYSDKEDLLEKIKFYQQNPELSMQISLEGQKEVALKHNISKRFKELYLKINKN